MTIHEAIPNIMAEIGAIGKDKKNAQQGFMYRGVDDVMNAIQPLLHKHGIFIVPEVLDHKREDRVSSKGNALIYSVCTIRYTFYSSDGSSISAVVVGEGMDSGDKATNKAMAIAFKYACFQVFCIPTEEMKDPDSETPPETQPMRERPQTHAPATPQFLCDDCGKVITPYTDAHGQVVGVRRIANESEKKFGKPLCISCATARANINESKNN